MMKMLKNRKKRVCAGMAALLAASCVLSACSKKESDAQETRKLIMGTFTEDSVMDRAGKAVAATISNTVPGIYVETDRKSTRLNSSH